MLPGLALDSMRLALSRPFRSLLIKSLLLTATLLAAVFFAVQGIVDWMVDFESAWINLFARIVTGLGLIIALGFMVAPVAGLFAGFYLDDVAELVECERYPDDRVGQEQPLWPSLVRTARFTVIVIATNAVALLLVLVFGLGLPIFFIANAFLLGREYFQLAALRHIPDLAARQIMGANKATVFLSGLLIAGVLAIPVINLIAPLFGTILMVQVFKKLASDRVPSPTPMV